MNLEYILKSLQILTTAEAGAKWSTQPRIILEMAMIKLVKLEEELSLEERIKRLEMGIVKTVASPIDQRSAERKESTIKQGESKDIKVDKEQVKTTEILDDGSELTLETIKSEWAKVMQTIKIKKINIYALLLEGEVSSYENNLLTIGYKEGFGFHKEAISSANNKEFVEEVVSTHFKKPIKMTSTMGNKSTKSQVVADDSKEKAIKGVMDFFGEDVVEII